MELKEALINLDQVCSEFKGTRTDHVALQQSMQTIRDATSPPVDADPLDSTEDITDGDKEPDGNN